MAHEENLKAKEQACNLKLQKISDILAHSNTNDPESTGLLDKSRQLLAQAPPNLSSTLQQKGPAGVRKSRVIGGGQNSKYNRLKKLQQAQMGLIKATSEMQHAYNSSGVPFTNTYSSQKAGPAAEGGSM